jgi:hypothetical protein
MKSKAHIATLLWWESRWRHTFEALRAGWPRPSQGWALPDGQLPLPDYRVTKDRLVEFLRKLILQAEQGPRPKHVTTPEEIRQHRKRSRKKLANKQIEVWDPPGHPAEPDIWERLKRATKPQQVRRVCSQSRHWLNPKRSELGRILYKHADQFLEAKADPAYPRSERGSSENKRIQFLARAMAGVSVGMSPATGVDLLRKAKVPSHKNP